MINKLLFCLLPLSLVACDYNRNIIKAEPLARPLQFSELYNPKNGYVIYCTGKPLKPIYSYEKDGKLHYAHSVESSNNYISDNGEPIELNYLVKNGKKSDAALYYLDKDNKEVPVFEAFPHDKNAQYLYVDTNKNSISPDIVRIKHEEIYNLKLSLNKDNIPEFKRIMKEIQEDKNITGVVNDKGEEIQLYVCSIPD